MSRPPSLRAGGSGRRCRRSLTGTALAQKAATRQTGRRCAPGLVLNLRKLLGTADLEHLAEQLDGQVPDVAWCKQGLAFSVCIPNLLSELSERMRKALTRVWQRGHTEVCLELHQAVDAQALERRRPENRHGSLESLHSGAVHCYSIPSGPLNGLGPNSVLLCCEDARLDLSSGECTVVH